MTFGDFVDEQTPDFYAEAVQIGLGPFGIVLAFAKQPTPGTGNTPIPVCTVRMSLEHAKVLAIILKKNIREMESQMGVDIPLHPKIGTTLGISIREDW